MAAHPSSSTSCDDTPGKLEPRIDPLRCEGKADCLRVCPYDVFVLRPLDRDEKRVLTPMVRFKIWAHGGKQAFVERPDACHACGLCVTACPEKAIKLVRGMATVAAG
ncbi:MAG: ferredoxin family protein [Pseudomonadota bacterium]|nr:ferredoxin family protein [Pseudomonadota bacterium]